MAAIAGYKARVQIGALAGTTTRTDYAMTDSGDGLVWHTSTGDRYIFDPGTPITVEVDATPTASGWTFDYLLGLLTFDADQSGSTVTITGESFDMFTIAQASSATISITAQMLDQTVFQNTAINRLAGLFDVTGTVSRFEVGTADYDSGAGTFTIFNEILNRRTVVLELRPDLTLDGVYRCFALLESEEESAGVADLQTAVFTFQGTVPPGGTVSVAYGDPIV